MALRRPHLAKPFYEALPALYAVIGAAAIAVSYFRLKGTASVTVALAGTAALVAGAVIALRRRDYRQLRDEYAGREINPSPPEPPA
jgi:hypothetical protein